MNTMNNQKVIEVLEKTSAYNYYEKVMNAKSHKITLFSVFPYSAAANLSDPRPIVLIDDLKNLQWLNSGQFYN